MGAKSERWSVFLTAWPGAIGSESELLLGALGILRAGGRVFLSRREGP